MVAGKHRFGIDIDGTVTCPATLLPHINRQYNINMTIADVTEYDFLSGFPHPVDRQQFNLWFKENEPYMYQVSELAADAQAILTEWQKNMSSIIYPRVVQMCLMLRKTGSLNLMCPMITLS